MQAIQTSAYFQGFKPSPASRLLQLKPSPASRLLQKKPMPRELHKGHAALRRGRVSIPGAEYFLTVCTDKRRTGLTAHETATSILGELQAMDDDSTWHLRCTIVMPDHIHLLVILGQHLPLGKTIARLKSKTSALLRKFTAPLDWERDFFDHHVRPDDDRLGIFLYIFLNPYRAGLSTRSERWPWYYCCEEDWAWFKAYLDAERPAPEWLKD